MHMLTNHIQSVHVDDQDPIEVQENPEKPKEIQEEIQEDPTRTGEIATLEKPFQCEHCDKCFGDYHIFPIMWNITMDFPGNVMFLNVRQFANPFKNLSNIMSNIRNPILFCLRNSKQKLKLLCLVLNVMHP